MISHLRELEKKATKGPWAAEFAEACNIRAPHGGNICQLCHLKGRHGALGRVDGDEVEANAAFIVALRNAAQPLIELARESVGVYKAHNFGGKFCGCNVCANVRALKEATP